MDVISIIAYFSFFLGLFISINYLMHYLKPEEEKEVEIKEWPRIAIIVPAYNEEKNVEDTLTSLSSLNYPKDKLKIIFVDDGSKDNTYKKALEVAEKLNKKYKVDLIEVYTKKNGGKASTLNFGIKKVMDKTDYIVCMDADSIVDKEALIHLIKKMESLPKEYMACVSTMNVYNPHNFLLKLQAIEYYISNFFRKVFHKAKWIYITPGPFSIYRSEFFKKCGLFKEDDITEDTEIGMRINACGYKIAYEENSLVHTKAPEKYKGLLKQRTRWYLGLIEDILYYKNKLVALKEIGLFILPTVLIMWVVTLLFTFLMIKEDYIMPWYYRLKDLIILKTDVIYLIKDWFQNLSFSWSFSFYHYFFIVMFILALFNFILSLYSWRKSKKDKDWFKDKKQLFKWFIIFIFVYPFLYISFIASTFYSKLFARELRFGNLKWQNSLLNKIIRKLKRKNQAINNTT